MKGPLKGLILTLNKTTFEDFLFQEYLLITPDPSCHVSDLTLSIIDTPGIEDTAGPMQVTNKSLTRVAD